MKLHWGSLSPFVRKVLIVAYETGLAEKIAIVPTVVGMLKPNADLMTDNPLSKIPTLILNDGTAIYDSRAICEYLDTLHGGTKFFPAPGPARWDALTRQALGDGMVDALLLWRQERLKTPERQTPELMAAFSLKIEMSLDHLEKQAGQLKQKPFDIGQVALGCMLSYLDVRFGDLGWREHCPQLATWHVEFEKRSSVAATKPELKA